MHLISTRNSDNVVTFEQAVLDCMPKDGGLYVPADDADLRRWILYIDGKTSFASIAGALTSALINDEFSPIICETIATRAFPFEPVVKKLEDNFYMLELFHGPTGSHKDFGISYLASCVETILTLENKHAIFLDVTNGELGSCLARELRGKKRIKAVLVYPKGSLRGLEDSDLVENGGNICAVEVDGTEKDCHEIVKQIFADRDIVKKYGLTVANTANIGRLFPQAFFYTFAFSRLKASVYGDIYYSLEAGNYSNVVAGLYSWKYSLPVKGFIVPATDSLTVDVMGNCQLLDSVVPVEKRLPANPASPSNIERLENVFKANSLMMKNLVFPADVPECEIESACKELFMKYHVFADKSTCKAYIAARKHMGKMEDDDCATVLVARDDPALSSDFIKMCLGEAPDMKEGVALALKPYKQSKAPLSVYDAFDSLIAIIEDLHSSQLAG